MHAALDAGANAIEPDVNVYDNYEDQLCVGHGEGDADAPSLAKFLTDLHDVAVKRPELALVVFDCKPKVATAQHGATLLAIIRNLLTFDNNLNVIISVAKLSEGAIFDSIRSILERREGLMIDEEHDPEAVSAFFSDIDHRCYGNGIANVFQRKHHPGAHATSCRSVWGYSNKGT